MEVNQKIKDDKFFGIGVVNSKFEVNIGTLWRSALIFGASYIFTIGRRYREQPTDVLKTWSKIPLFHYTTFADFKKALPFNTRLVGIEKQESGVDLRKFEHPDRCVYLLGPEDGSIPKHMMEQCHQICMIEGCHSLNVSVAGSIVMYDRFSKLEEV